ncbi:MAG: type II toxin-antitoxin system HicB family antitoxin [Nanoarchaeota archaeon]|nr:type II toxin-antitoxin system HicB family antitoxin [Nanoarchaeota archaeon]
MEGKIGMNILVREEESEDGKVFVVNSEELGVSDFGVTLDEAIENFRKSVAMYLEVYPEKKELLVVQGKKPLLMSRIFL